METIHLTAEVTSIEWTDLIPSAKVETLDECFRRNHTEHTLHGDAERHADYLSLFGRATAWGRVRPTESLPIVQINAAWLAARLDEIQAEWNTKIDALLADYRNDRINHEAYCQRLNAIEVSCGVKRTNATKAAYGITYKEFVK